MKKLFSLFFALVATTALWAYDFQFGDLYYNITSSGEPYTVEVTYQVQGSSRNYAGLTSFTIPETVTYSGITYSVTSIGDYAFFYCSGLTSVTIPNSVTSIGYEAFSNCSSLTSIVIPNGVTSIGESTFSDCSSLTSIIVPDSVTSIGGWAFQNCSSLTSITIGSSTKSIGVYTFYGCSLLTSILVKSGNTKYDSRDNCNAIIETATNTLTHGCKNTVIPNSVTSIGELAFCGCSSLTSITIPHSVASIGENAFANCSSLPVENNLRYADTYLVEAVDKTLSTYSIKEGTKWIGTSAFSYCSSLVSITIPNNVTNIECDAFANCSSLNSITVPNSVTSIGESAFQNCSSLTSIAIPNGVTSIENYSFANCSKLTFIAIPNSVTSIGLSAFYNCSSLTSITIPNSVTNMGNFAFQKCSSLDTIYCYATTPPMLKSSTFVDYNGGPTRYGATLYVSCNALTVYQTHEVWGLFADIQCILDEDDTDTPDTPTSILDNQAIITNTQKLIRDGQILIIYDGKTYNAQGAVIN